MPVYFFSDELVILLVGSGDSRHILKTMAQSYRHGDRRLHVRSFHMHLLRVLHPVFTTNFHPGCVVCKSFFFFFVVKLEIFGSLLPNLSEELILMQSSLTDPGHHKDRFMSRTYTDLNDLKLHP